MPLLPPRRPRKVYLLKYSRGANRDLPQPIQDLFGELQQRRKEQRRLFVRVIRPTRNPVDVVSAYLKAPSTNFIERITPQGSRFIRQWNAPADVDPRAWRTAMVSRGQTLVDMHHFREQIKKEKTELTRRAEQIVREHGPDAEYVVLVPPKGEAMLFINGQPFRPIPRRFPGEEE